MVNPAPVRSGPFPRARRGAAAMVFIVLLPLFVGDVGFPGVFRDPGRQWAAYRSVEGRNLVEIGQAMLREDQAHPGALSAGHVADVYAVAAQLARDGELRGPEIWFSQLEPARFPWQDSSTGAPEPGVSAPVTIVDPAPDGGRTSIDPRFQQAPLAVAVALFAPEIRLKDLPAKTPLAWTRGLQPDGSWRSDSPYGDWGGFVVFADGTLRQFDRSLAGRLVKFGTSQPTSILAEALPPGTRVSEFDPPPGTAALSEATRGQTRLAEISNIVVPIVVVVVLPMLIWARIRLGRRPQSPVRAIGLTLAAASLFFVLLYLVGYI